MACSRAVALPRVPFYHQLSNEAGSGKGLFTIDIVILKYA
jgi:hypothetical protein